MPKIIVIGADHAGFERKERIKIFLQAHGCIVEDASPAFVADDDYPLVAQRIAHMVSRHSGQLGILVCGSGFGMEIAANRFKGVRAAAVRTVAEAKLSRQHNHANVLVIGAWMNSWSQTRQIVTAWLKTPWSRATRHIRRVRELDAV